MVRIFLAFFATGICLVCSALTGYASRIAAYGNFDDFEQSDFRLL